MTMGAHGVRIDRVGEEPIVVKAIPDVKAVDPTGVGDAFRGGFVGALAWGLGHERAGQVGCAVAAFVVETLGTQEYVLSKRAFLDRMELAYGPEAAMEVEPLVRCDRP
jgi:adenosine kinase